MKVLSVQAELCTGCHLCEETCAETWFHVRDREKAAIRVYDPAPGTTTYRIVVCSQCGECIDICQTVAIARNAFGVVRIDQGRRGEDRLCMGCMACVAFCPIGAMRYHPDELTPFKCVACGKCVKVCPSGALRIEEVPEPGRSQTEMWAERVMS